MLRATWYLASVFGLGFSAILFAAGTGRIALDSITTNAVIRAFPRGSTVVLWATWGKYPGWIVLFVVAALIYFGGAKLPFA